MFSKIVLIFFVTSSSVVLSVNAIKCYECNSITNAECNNLGDYRPHLTVGFYKECNEYEKYGDKLPFCRTTVITVYFPENEVRTYRSCAWVKSELPPTLNCTKRDDDFHTEYSCECFDDGCNSSSILGLSTLAFLILSVFVCVL